MRAIAKRANRRGSGCPSVCITGVNPDENVRDLIPPRLLVQFQKGLSEPAFEQQYDTEAARL